MKGTIMYQRHYSDDNKHNNNNMNDNDDENDEENMEFVGLLPNNGSTTRSSNDNQIRDSNGGNLLAGLNNEEAASIVPQTTTGSTTSSSSTNSTNSTNTISRTGMYVLGLLAIQNCIKNLLVRYVMKDTPKFLTSAAVIGSEVCKLTLSILYILVIEKRSYYSIYYFVCTKDIRNTVLLIIPASAYNLQMSLEYIALGNIDASTFSVIVQCKLICTAIFSYIVLQKKLYTIQIISLVLLTIGVMLCNMKTTTNTDVVDTEKWTQGIMATIGIALSSGFASVYTEKVIKGGGNKGSSTSSSGANNDDNEILAIQKKDHIDTNDLEHSTIIANDSTWASPMSNKQQQQHLTSSTVTDSISVLTNTNTNVSNRTSNKVGTSPSSPPVSPPVSSSLSLSHKRHQQQQQVQVQQISSSLQSVQQYGLAYTQVQLAIMSLVTIGIYSCYYDYSDIISKGLFYNFTYAASFSVLWSSIGGLIVAGVLKYADSIVKGYATALSVIFTGILSMVLFNTSLSLLYCIGITNVIIAVLLYNSNKDSLHTYVC